MNDRIFCLEAGLDPAQAAAEVPLLNAESQINNLRYKHEALFTSFLWSQKSLTLGANAFARGSAVS